MGKYNFDEIIDRHNSNSLKWDFNTQRGRSKDIMPFWVADLDFRLPDIILDELKEKINHGIFGYSEPLDSYFETIIDWNKKQYGIDLDRKYIINGPGVVFSIATLIKAITNVGDSILISEPVYYPFRETIEANLRKTIVSELTKDSNNRYSVDFKDFEEKVKKNNVKLYILCNPHNPVGRVWKKEELEKIYELSQKYNFFVISDEIHEDFIYNLEFTSLAKVFKENYAIVTAPTKSFNIPGLHSAYSYIPNDEILKKYKDELTKDGYSQSNVIGIKALEVCYKNGRDWLNELKEYIYNNYLFLVDYLNKYLPKIKVTPLEATYLVWLDFSAYNKTPSELKDLIENKCNLWLDGGYIFGKSGIGFERINIGTQRSYLLKALESLYSVFKDL